MSPPMLMVLVWICLAATSHERRLKTMHGNPCHEAWSSNQILDRASMSRPGHRAKSREYLAQLLAQDNPLVGFQAVGPGCSKRHSRSVSSQRSMVRNELETRRFSTPILDLRGGEMCPYPIRVMIFIDGSWLFHSFNAKAVAVSPLLGEAWSYSHFVDYNQLPRLIVNALQKQYLERHGEQRFVDVVRTTVYDAVPEGQMQDGKGSRHDFLEALKNTRFELHIEDQPAQHPHQKSVEITLAVDMMYCATMQGSYDVAVLVSGDRDFLPVMKKVRQMGRRVALCSTRKACSQSLLDPAAHVRDFDPIWLDDHLETILVRNNNTIMDNEQLMSKKELIDVVASYLLQQEGCQATSTSIGAHLMQQIVNGRDALSQLKQQYRNLISFMLACKTFDTENADGIQYLVKLNRTEYVRKSRNAKLADANSRKSSKMRSGAARNSNERGDPF